MKIVVLRFSSVLAAITLIFFAVTSHASANEIALRLNEIPRGLVVVYEKSDGSIFSVHYVGPTSKGYRKDTYAGDMQSGPTRTSYLDPEGNTLSYTQPSGKSRTYSPHYCNRTLGTCQVSLVDESGNKRSITVITRATSKGYRQEQRQNVDGKRYEFNTQITLTTYGIRGFERKEDGRTIKMINSYVRN